MLCIGNKCRAHWRGLELGGIIIMKEYSKRAIARIKEEIEYLREFEAFENKRSKIKVGPGQISSCINCKNFKYISKKKDPSFIPGYYCTSGMRVIVKDPINLRERTLVGGHGDERIHETIDFDIMPDWCPLPDWYNLDKSLAQILTKIV